MKKIQSLFKRDYEGTRLVYDEVVPGAEWVQRGEGKATQKFDGTACMVKNGILYKRYDVKKGRLVPPNAIPCEEKPNEHTGHWPHWVKVGDGPEDKYFREAYNACLDQFDETPMDGTYELCGPKINKNMEGYSSHILIAHGSVWYNDAPTEYDALKAWLSDKDIEGIVWHHPDGRMVKIKKKDFGLKRKP